jgi:rhomboid protease GluP
MDLDSALIFLVVATAFVSGAAAVKVKAWRWLGVQVLNLAVVGAAWLFARQWLSAIVAPVWLLTVIAPSLAVRWSDRMMRAERFGIAVALARIGAALHPTPATKLRVLVAQTQRAEQSGAREEEATLLAKLAQTQGGETLAHLLGLRLDLRWQDVRAWIEQRPTMIATEPVVLSFFLRALGELGDVETLCAAFEIAPKTPAYAAIEDQALLFVTAFCGREAALEAVLVSRHADMPDDAKRLWRATAAQSAGKDVRDELTALSKSEKPRLAAVARSRIETPLPPATPSDTSRTVIDAVEQATKKLEPARPRSPTASTVIIAVNAYVFLRELPGGSENETNLARLGALYTNGLDAYAAYRLFTATVLHYGLLHVAMNMLGLFVLGRSLEAVVGRARFVAIYVGSGVAANALYVLWTAHTGRHVQTLVGASGCVMGVAGALLVRRIIRWRVQRAALARSEVVTLGSILVLQTIFDYRTPEIAGAVHLFGAGVGALLGLVLGRPPTKVAPKPRSPNPARLFAVAAVVMSVVGLELLWWRTSNERPPVCHEDCEQRCNELARAPGKYRNAWQLAFKCYDIAASLASADAGAKERAQALAFAESACVGGDDRGCDLASKIDMTGCARGQAAACERNCMRWFELSAPDRQRNDERTKRMRDDCVALLAQKPSTAREETHSLEIAQALCDAGDGRGCIIRDDSLTSPESRLNAERINAMVRDAGFPAADDAGDDELR